jgi:amino acid transporter
VALIRAIRRWDLVALAINGIIGAGIFGLPSEVFARVGVHSLLAFLVCAVAVTLIILCFAEVSSRFSETGGPYLYARTAFGPLAGFEVGWMIWVSRLTAFAANLNILVAYFSVFVPGAAAGAGRAATITAVTLALTAVNIVGVREATRVTNVLTIAKLTPLVLFVGAGVFFVDSTRLTWPDAAPPFGEFSLSVLLLVFAFTGFEMAAVPAGESRDPQRDLPRALLTAIAIVAVFYMLIQVVAIGTLPDLARSTRPLADAGGRMFGAAGSALVAAGAVVSILGNLNVTMLVVPRIPFAMAERGELPAGFGATHPRFRTPYVAVLVTAALVLVLALSGTFVYAATVSVIARLLAYGATCAALVVLRRSPAAPPARLVVPAGVAVAGVSLVLVAWLLVNSTGQQARDAALAAVVGVVLYGVSRRRST